jgi:glycosyltransferase involved in cell wall biosynthesis
MKFNDIQSLIQIDSPELPIIIPTFNNPTYLKNTVDYFLERDFNIIVLDNASTYPPMLELLFELSENNKCYVVMQNSNQGPRQFFYDNSFYNWLPNYFYATDPDLGYNKDLTREDWLSFIDISERLDMYKVGVGMRLDIEDSNILDLVRNYGYMTSIRELENGYYNSPCSATEQGDIIYNAPIDTTFALYNKKNQPVSGNNFMDKNVRVRGRFDSWHYGWFDPQPIPAEEQEFYTEACKPYVFSSGEVVRRGEGATY